MAGAGSTYFQEKMNQYAAEAERAQAAVAKVNAAKQGLALLAKPTLTQEEAETLIALHDAAN